MNNQTINYENLYDLNKIVDWIINDVIFVFFIVISPYINFESILRLIPQLIII